MSEAISYHLEKLENLGGWSMLEPAGVKSQLL